MTHPGEMLVSEFLIQNDMSWTKIIELQPNIAARDVLDVVQRVGPVTFDLATAFAAVFLTSVEFWLELQADYDLAIQEISNA